MSNIYHEKTFTSIIVEHLLKRDTSRVAFMFNEQQITVEELNKQTNLFIMNLQKLGINKGDVVGYSFPNSPDAIYTLIALARMGACTIPLFHMIPPMDRVGILLNGRAKIIITDSSQAKVLKEAVTQMKAPLKVITTDECSDSDGTFITDPAQLSMDQSSLDNVEENLPLMIASSSGTTGVPKPVLFTQKNGAASLKSSYELAMPAQYDGKDGYSCMTAFPFSTAGILVVLGMAVAGVSCIFTHDMSPVKFLELIQHYKADSMAAPPAYYEGMLRLPHLTQFELSSVTKVFSGMDFFSNKLIMRLKEKIPTITRAGNGYGLIETTNIFMFWKADNEDELTNPSNVLSLVENVGNEIEVFNTENKPCAVNEEGELRMRGNSNIRGYLANEEVNAQAYHEGWFKTGDFAKKIDNNKIALLGRKKYVIKRGGRSVSPLVVKEVIEKVPGVVSAAVVGVPQALYGEMIWAYVVRVPDIKVTEGEIMRACRENLVNYMVPDNIEFIDEIPKNPGVGKVNIELLKEMAIKGLEKLGGMTNE